MDELYVHYVRYHQWNQKDRQDDIRAALGKLCDQMKLGDPSARIHLCPVAKCKRRLSRSDFADHILRHEQREIDESEDALRRANWIPVRGKCRHSHTSQRDWCDCSFTEIQVCCPVCYSAMDLNSFEEHMELVHLVDKAQVEHFMAWKAHCQSGRPVTHLWLLDRETTCPVCDWTGATVLPWSKSRYLHDHHLGMLRKDLEDLKPYRMEILRLYTGLHHNSSNEALTRIWDDLAQPLRVTESNEAGPSTA